MTERKEFWWVQDRCWDGKPIVRLAELTYRDDHLVYAHFMGTDCPAEDDDELGEIKLIERVLPPASAAGIEVR